MTDTLPSVGGKDWEIPSNKYSGSAGSVHNFNAPDNCADFDQPAANPIDPRAGLRGFSVVRDMRQSSLSDSTDIPAEVISNLWVPTQLLHQPPLEGSYG